MMLTRIASVAEAVRALEESHEYLAVQLEIVPPCWKVFTRDHQFEAVFSPQELIEFAWLRCHDAFERALVCLRSVGIEVIVTDGGFILRGISAENHDVELTCDSEAELMRMRPASRLHLVKRSCAAVRR